MAGKRNHAPIHQANVGGDNVNIDDNKDFNFMSNMNRDTTARRTTQTRIPCSEMEYRKIVQRLNQATQRLLGIDKNIDETPRMINDEAVIIQSRIALIEVAKLWHTVNNSDYQEHPAAIKANGASSMDTESNRVMKLGGLLGGLIDDFKAIRNAKAKRAKAAKARKAKKAKSTKKQTTKAKK